MNKEDLVEEIRVARSSLTMLCYILIAALFLLGGFLTWAIPFILEFLR